ncbi:MAG: flagellar motor protein MotB [Methylomonas sp.]|nr:MAG: flagellar motor protein MotB [Methylomonas sp.]
MIIKSMNNSVHRILKGVYACCILALTACSQSYVVLLEEEDGSLGKVQVTTSKGTTVLENNRDGMDLHAEAGKTFAVSDKQIKQDFAGALAASPQKPLSFYLYFEGGSSSLTAESQAEVPKIIVEINKRPGVDISIIGHTDTVGDEQNNARLSLERAKSVAQLFKDALPDTEKVTIDSHGEKNLLIATPDDTDEPKNRRVEVMVR